MLKNNNWVAHLDIQIGEFEEKSKRLITSQHKLPEILNRTLILLDEAHNEHGLLGDDPDIDKLLEVFGTYDQSVLDRMDNAISVDYLDPLNLSDAFIIERADVINKSHNVVNIDLVANSLIDTLMHSNSDDIDYAEAEKYNPELCDMITKIKNKISENAQNSIVESSEEIYKWLIKDLGGETGDDKGTCYFKMNIDRAISHAFSEVEFTRSYAVQAHSYTEAKLNLYKLIFKNFLFFEDVPDSFYLNLDSISKLKVNDLEEDLSNYQAALKKWELSSEGEKPHLESFITGIGNPEFVEENLEYIINHFDEIPFGGSEGEIFIQYEFDENNTGYLGEIEAIDALSFDVLKNNGAFDIVI